MFNQVKSLIFQRGWLVLLSAVVLGCAPITTPGLSPSSTINRTPQAVEPGTSTPAPINESVPTKAILIESPVPGATTAGTRTTLQFTFRPILYQAFVDANGNISGFSQREWIAPNVIEMRTCISPNQPCTPGGDWQPFQDQLTETIDVNWLGQRDVYLGAEFRDSQGNSVPSSKGGYDEPPQPMTQIKLSLNSAIDDKTPIAQQAPLIQTLAAPTLLAFPVTGSVKILGSPCCIGGKIGSVLEVPVSFTAASQSGKVNEMRIAHSCPNETEIQRSDWEQMVPQKTYTTTAVSGFVGWYIGVQYRDEKGNLSRVYCDNISVEGMP